MRGGVKAHQGNPQPYLGKESTVSQYEYKQFRKRNLSHIQPPEAILFITFRLDGSIPQAVLDQWLMEKRKLEAVWKRLAATAPPGVQPEAEAKAEDRLNQQRRWFMKFEDELHCETCGPVWLKEDRIAEIIIEALHHRDGKVYRLDAYCVMPNHVHVVFAPFLTEAQAQKLANRVLRRQQSDLMPTTQTDSLRNSGEDSVLSNHAIAEGIYGAKVQHGIGQERRVLAAREF
jgi:hypothetical protein